MKFQIDRQTPTSFYSKGVISGFETDVRYTQSNNEIAMLQKSLRGSNRFFTCEEPVLKKEE